MFETIGIDNIFGNGLQLGCYALFDDDTELWQLSLLTIFTRGLEGSEGFESLIIRFSRIDDATRHEKIRIVVIARKRIKASGKVESCGKGRTLNYVTFADTFHRETTLVVSLTPKRKRISMLHFV